MGIRVVRHSSIDYHDILLVVFLSLSQTEILLNGDLRTVRTCLVVVRPSNRYVQIILGGQMFNVLAIGLKVCALKPGRRRWIFEGVNSQPDFLRRGSKAVDINVTC
jgi:hypothetical protein